MKRFQMETTATASTPLQPSLPLLTARPNDKKANQQLYQELVGSLNHIAVFSRPDISCAVSQHSQFNKDLSETHLMSCDASTLHVTGETPMETPKRCIFGDMLMRIGAAIGTTGNQRWDTSLSPTTALCHGHLTNNQRSRYQRWKRNICLSRMPQEKYLHDVNYFGISTSSFQSLSSIRTIKEPLPSRTIQQTINERNKSIFGTTSYARRSKTTRFGSITSPQLNNSLTSSTKSLGPQKHHNSGQLLSLFDRSSSRL
jgi:hypothetical protein